MPWVLVDTIRAEGQAWVLAGFKVIGCEHDARSQTFDVT
jgi:hypothetical protein